MNYKKRIEDAVLRTKKLQLKLPSSPLPFSKAISDNKKQEILIHCFEVLQFHGFKSSQDLASKCTDVHLMLQYFLKTDLNIDSHITIGDRYWHDYIYCEMSDESIKSELNSPSLDEPIKAHVWLTLTDGTILDCTGEAHADLIFSRGNFPLHECLHLSAPSEKEDAIEGYYRPYLIGTDFLEKTGVCKILIPS
ncbi:hypothetical protein [Pseudoalteromonas sp. S554]|uniref:hypothetical protein n=1 Tax=Pseudoalteromonas sp. S554 TaxID=2066516 RepID=UPI00110C8DE5|nr:hypothetical protein [Pseudoalteromonas sp. S554]TMS82221.1 hypothetical protein CWB65_06315 [Pseudoalteromonas sp. S554]